MKPVIIKTSNLLYSVPMGDSTLEILKGIDFEIHSGESLAIVGASGSGKSTLLGLLAGLDIATSGEVQLAEHDLTRLDEEARASVRRQWVSFVFQNFQLLGSLTALENVMLPLELKQTEGARSRAEQYLSRVGLDQRMTHYPNQLSGGEQQRVALARAFACETPILFADEPTGNLDADTGQHVADLLFDMNRESNTTLVLVTHSNVLAKRCDRRIEMRAGRIQEQVA